MADIAAIFHWPPSAFEDMNVEDIAMWREQARQRSGAES
ncbi:MAG TPA: GpE family phage tail protein [Rhodocyclaceae bacterium]